MIPTTNRRSPVYTGTGAAASYAFAFKVFAKADIAVRVTDTAGVESTWALDAQYTVALNADQDNFPGGTVAPVGALPAGYSLVVVGNQAYSQTTQLPNGGAYNAVIAERAMDRIVIMAQQLAETAGRSLQIPPSEGAALQLPAAAARKNKLLGFNPATGQPEMSSFTLSQVAAAIAASFPFVQGVQSVGSVSALTYGVTMSGAADESTAFNAATAAAVLLGVALYVPAGTVLLSNVVLPSGLRLVGAGVGKTILKRAPAATRCISDVGDVDLQDLTIDGGDAAPWADLTLDDSRALRITTAGRKVTGRRVRCINSKWSGLYQTQGVLAIDDLDCSNNGNSGCRLDRPLKGSELLRPKSDDCDHSGIYASGDTTNLLKQGSLVLISPQVRRVLNTQRLVDVGQSGNGVHGYLLEEFRVVDPYVERTQHSSIRSARTEQFSCMGGDLIDAGDTSIYDEFTSRHGRIVGVYANPMGKSRLASVTPSATTGAVTLTADAALFTAADVGLEFFINAGRIAITGFTDSTHLTGTVSANAALFSTAVAAPGEWYIGMPFREAATTLREYQSKIGITSVNAVSGGPNRGTTITANVVRAGLGIQAEGMAAITGNSIEADLLGAAIAPVSGAGQTWGHRISFDGNTIYDAKTTKTLVAGIGTAVDFSTNGERPVLAIGDNAIFDATYKILGMVGKTIYNGATFWGMPDYAEGLLHTDDGFQHVSRDYASHAAWGNLATTVSGRAQVMVEVGRIPYVNATDPRSANRIDSRMLHLEVFGGREATITSQNDRAVTTYMIGAKGTGTGYAKLVYAERHHGSARDHSLLFYDTGIDFAVVLSMANQQYNVSARARYQGAWQLYGSANNPRYHTNVMHALRVVDPAALGWTDDTVNWTTKWCFTTDADANFGNELGKGWQGGHIVLTDANGSVYHLFVDTTGKLRIKNGKPTTDLDGIVVGTQT